MRLIMCLIVALTGGPAAAIETVAVIRGMAHAVDGDGVGFGDIDVRLRGIAAPEFNSYSVQPGGRESAAHLAALIDGREVVCHLDGTIAGNRPVGVCYVDGLDLNNHQVRTGHALDCPAYSDGLYARSQVSAIADGHNLSRTYRLPGYC